MAKRVISVLLATVMTVSLLVAVAAREIRAVLTQAQARTRRMLPALLMRLKIPVRQHQATTRERFVSSISNPKFLMQCRK